MTPGNNYGNRDNGVYQDDDYENGDNGYNEDNDGGNDNDEYDNYTETIDGFDDGREDYQILIPFKIAIFLDNNLYFIIPRETKARKCSQSM